MVNDGSILGLALFLIIWLLPIFSREFRFGGRVLLAYWFVIVLHQIVVFTTAFGFVIKGADKDATAFHQKGVLWVQTGDFVFTSGAKFYSSMLGVAYWLFGSSHLLGMQLSVLMFAISCIILVKILRLLELSYYKAPALLVFGALPSMVIFGSVTLRESYQSLFFMLAVYFGIKMHLKKGINFYLGALIISALAMGLLHKGLFVFSVFLIVLLTVWSPRPTSHLWCIKKWRLMAVIIIPALLLGVFALMKTGLGGMMIELINKGSLEFSSTYRNNMPVTRATYGISLDLSSLSATIYSSFMLYIYYLFTPFPWNLENTKDFVALMESISRMILIFFSVWHWRNAHGEQRRLVGLMLILYFCISFMWAMGTTNYGSAARHHILSWWIIVVTGAPLLVATLGRVWVSLMIRRPEYPKD